MFKSWRLMWHLDGWVLCGDCAMYCDWLLMAPVGKTQDKWTTGKRSSWMASCSAEGSKLTLLWYKQQDGLFVEWQGKGIWLLPLHVFKTTCILPNPHSLMSSRNTKAQNCLITFQLTQMFQFFTLFVFSAVYLYSKPLFSKRVMFLKNCILDKSTLRPNISWIQLR
jgi:hypothetical protein